MAKINDNMTDKEINILTMQRLGWSSVTDGNGNWNIYLDYMLDDPIKSYPYTSEQEAWEQDSLDFCDSIHAMRDLLGLARNVKWYIESTPTERIYGWYQVQFGEDVNYTGSHMGRTIAIAWNLWWESNND